MVIKKIKNPRISSSKTDRITALGRYITRPESNNGIEKCVYFHGYNFIPDDVEGWITEMLATSLQTVRSRDTVIHYVVSWHEYEEPFPLIARECCDTLLTELGLEKHQAILGLHYDRDNTHFHLMANRTHPETLQCIDLGFDIRDSHRAIARMCAKRGWDCEERALFEEIDGDIYLRTHINREPDVRRPRLSQGAERNEQYKGTESVQRRMQNLLPPVLTWVKSWPDFHQCLAERGCIYQLKGRGAVIRRGKVHVKASSVGPEFCLKSLVTLLGDYVPAGGEMETLAGQNILKDKSLPGYENFVSEYENTMDTRDASVSLARKKRDEKLTLLEDDAEKKHDLFDDLSNKDLKNPIIRSILHASVENEKNKLSREVKSRYRSVVSKIYKENKVPDLPLWRKAHTKKINASIKSADYVFNILSQDGIMGKKNPQEHTQCKLAYADEQGNRYFYSPESRWLPAFVDNGAMINILHPELKGAVVDAICHASYQSSSDILIESNNEYYTSLALKIAVANGIAVANEELREAYNLEKKSFLQAVDAGQSLQEYQYYNALKNALCYEYLRITSSDPLRNGNGQNISSQLMPSGLCYLDEQVAFYCNYAKTSPALAKHDILLTPISDRFVYVQVDFFEDEKYNNFLENQFAPSLITQSGGGRRTAIIKLERDNKDQAIFKEAIKMFYQDVNKKFGLENCDQEYNHAKLPWFSNNQVNYSNNSEKQEARNLPEIIHVNSKCCTKSQNIINSLCEELSKKQKVDMEKLDDALNNMVNNSQSSQVYNIDFLNALVDCRYQFKEIIRNKHIPNSEIYNKISDISLDIALRMIVTGHMKESVAFALKSLVETLSKHYNKDEKWNFKIFADRIVEKATNSQYAKRCQAEYKAKIEANRSEDSDVDLQEYTEPDHGMDSLADENIRQSNDISVNNENGGEEDETDLIEPTR